MIIVFGAIYMDYHYDVDNIPNSGDTSQCTHMFVEPGGKAVRQAYAASKAGGRTAIVGRVGEDVYAKNILESIRKDGVMTSGVGRVSDQPTGSRSFMHVAGCKNAVVEMKGANQEILAEQVPDEILLEKNLILLQMDVCDKENREVLGRAQERGTKTMLNLAPVIKVPADMLMMIDILVVNKPEALQMAQHLGLDVEDNALKLAAALSQLGVLTCVVTLSEGGAVAVEDDGTGWQCDALPLMSEENDLELVDVTGAGDAFCGTLAALIEKGLKFPDALKRSCVAASLACMKRGGITSYAYSDEIDEHLDMIPDAQQMDI